MPPDTPNEHRSAFYHNSCSSNFALHLHDMAHSFGPIHNIMQVLHHPKKGAHLNTIERFHIHIEHAARKLAERRPSTIPNRIFETTIKMNAPDNPKTA
jgi:hypothetical protein